MLYHIHHFKEFLGFWYTDTDDVNIKNVLNDFKAANSREENMKKLKGKRVEHLKAALAYLGDWNKDDQIVDDEIGAYTKDGIVLLVTKKIYNMAPQNCPSCRKFTTSKLENLAYCPVLDVIL